MSSTIRFHKVCIRPDFLNKVTLRWLKSSATKYLMAQCLISGPSIAISVSSFPCGRAYPHTLAAWQNDCFEVYFIFRLQTVKLSPPCNSHATETEKRLSKTEAANQRPPPKKKSCQNMRPHLCFMFKPKPRDSSQRGKTHTLSQAKPKRLHRGGKTHTSSLFSAFMLAPCICTEGTINPTNQTKTASVTCPLFSALSTSQPQDIFRATSLLLQ